MTIKSMIPSSTGEWGKQKGSKYHVDICMLVGVADRRKTKNGVEIFFDLDFIMYGIIMRGKFTFLLLVYYCCRPP